MPIGGNQVDAQSIYPPQKGKDHTVFMCRENLQPRSTTLPQLFQAIDI
jgi:hypothetical protein